MVAYTDASNSWERAAYHREKLVKLGYLTHREYVFEQVQLECDEWKALAQQIEIAFPNSGRVDVYWELSMPGEPLRLQVWDRPDRTRVWSKFAQQLDDPNFRKQFMKSTKVVTEDATHNYDQTAASGSAGSP